MCHVVHAKQAHPHSGLGSCFCVLALDIFRLKNGMEWPCPMNSEVLRCCVQARLLSKNRIEQHFVCFYGTGDRVWCAWFDGKMLDKSSTMNCVFFLGRVYNMCQTLSPMRETERARVREQSISVLSVEKSVLQSHWKWNVNFHKMHPTREHVIYFTTNYWYKAPISVDYKGLSITFFLLFISHHTQSHRHIHIHGPLHFPRFDGKNERTEHKEWMCSFFLTLMVPQNHLKNEFYSKRRNGGCLFLITNITRCKKRHEYFWCCLLTTENHMGNKRNMNNGWHLNTFAHK